MKYTVLQRVSQNIDEVIARKTDLGIALWELLVQEHPADIAQFIISIPQPQATAIFLPLDKDLKLEIFGYLPEFARAELITDMPVQDKQFILTHTHADDISDMFAYLSDEELKECLKLLNKQDQKRVLDLSKFPSETAGGIMTIDVLTLMKDFTVAKSIELLQRLQPNKDLHQTIYVTDFEAHLVGYIQLQDLVLKSPDTRLESILEEVPYVALSHEGRKVLAVEDTSTTGGSVLTAVEALKEAGAIVVAVAVIVERGAASKVKEANLEYRAAFQLSDLGL